MELYQLYFRECDKETAYSSEQEFTEDLLAFTDMFLNLASWERDDGNERLDLRGIVITPQEHEKALGDRQLEVRCGTKESHIFRANGSNELQRAENHIRTRLDAGREARWEPRLATLLRRANLDTAERVCLMLAFAVEMDRKYERIYGYLQDNIAARMPTVGLGLSLAGLITYADERRNETRVLNEKASPLWRYFLDNTSPAENTSRLSRPMILKQTVLDYVNGILSEEEFWASTEWELSRTSESLGGCAFRVRLGYEWEDLILEEAQKKILRYICDRAVWRDVVMRQWGFEHKIRYGAGISALFYGAPGTGKTMAAQVIAKELNRELYKVDLSHMVSKYIGETEKNLGKVFDQARQKNAVLFFDEADALFAKRTDVKNSNDRYANMETGYLLQKMEEYEGITIMATNYINNLDDAFKRRIQFFVHFLSPNAEMRLELWKHMLPDEARLEEDLNFENYARQFETSGSEIRDILLCAAYFAAAQKRGICNEDIVYAIQLHYQKLGRTLSVQEILSDKPISLQDLP